MASPQIGKDLAPGTKQKIIKVTGKLEEAVIRDDSRFLLQKLERIVEEKKKKDAERASEVLDALR